MYIQEKFSYMHCIKSAVFHIISSVYKNQNIVSSYEIY